MGVRESSGALSYTLGDGKYTGYHIEICNKIVANLEKAAGRKLEVKYQVVTSQTAFRWFKTAPSILNVAPPPTTPHAKKTSLSCRQHSSKKSVLPSKPALVSVPLPSSMAKRLPPPPVQRRFKRCVKTNVQRALTSMKYLARTTRTASCCWSLAALKPL